MAYEVSTKQRNILTFALRYCVDRCDTFALSVCISQFKEISDSFTKNEIKSLLEYIENSTKFNSSPNCTSDTLLDFKSYLMRLLHE